MSENTQALRGYAGIWVRSPRDVGVSEGLSPQSGRITPGFSQHAAWRRTPAKWEGSEATQDLHPREGVVGKVPPEQKVLFTGQLCAQDSLGGDPVYLSPSQSKACLLSIPSQKTGWGPSSEWFSAMLTGPRGQRDPWRQ